MKYLVPILGAIGLLIVSCQPIVTLEKPNVAATPTDDGGKLSLSWNAITDADGYYIYLDGVKYDSTTSTNYVVSTPAQIVEVSAYAGDEESDKWKGDYTPVVNSVTVYGLSDPSPEHPSGLQLKDAGAIALSLEEANKPNIDYVFDDKAYAPAMYLINAGDYEGWPNTKGNASADAQTTDFDAVDIAPAPGVYNTQTEIATNGVYYLWLDRDNNQKTEGDNFGKLQVLSISDHKVEIKVAYQKFAGLRWVKTK